MSRSVCHKLHAFEKLFYFNAAEVTANKKGVKGLFLFYWNILNNLLLNLMQTEVNFDFFFIYFKCDSSFLSFSNEFCSFDARKYNCRTSNFKCSMYQRLSRRLQNLCIFWAVALGNNFFLP